MVSALGLGPGLPEKGGEQRAGRQACVLSLPPSIPLSLPPSPTLCSLLPKLLQLRRKWMPNIVSFTESLRHFPCCQPTTTMCLVDHPVPLTVKRWTPPLTWHCDNQKTCIHGCILSLKNARRSGQGLLPALLAFTQDRGWPQPSVV